MIQGGAIAVVAALILGPQGGQTAAPLAVSAEFTLRASDPVGREIITGTVTFVPGGKVCVQVKSPNRQELSLSPSEMVVYYPERDLALVAAIRPPHGPPMLEAIAAGVVDPASTLPKQSRMVEHVPSEGRLYTRWQVISDGGEDLGELRSWEAREGVIATELRSPAGKLQRRFSFADRVRVGARSVPRRIGAEYFTAAGAPGRQEQWELRAVAPFGASSTPLECARRGPKTTVAELPW